LAPIGELVLKKVISDETMLPKLKKMRTSEQEKKECHARAYGHPGFPYLDSRLRGNDGGCDMETKIIGLHL
jgi:hypothetical protein